VEDPATVESLGVASPAAQTGSGPGAGDAARLERLMARRPEAARAAVTLVYYKDLSVAEVAPALGVPEGTVKTHLHRARAALREGWLRETGEVDRAL
jgi:RNA polymerase sigma-70 factor (ECF subfamily)